MAMYRVCIRGGIGQMKRPGKPGSDAGYCEPSSQPPQYNCSQCTFSSMTLVPVVNFGTNANPGEDMLTRSRRPLVTGAVVAYVSSSAAMPFPTDKL